LLECSPVTQAARVRFPADTCLSRGALVEDGDDTGQVSSQYCVYLPAVLCLPSRSTVFTFLQYCVYLRQYCVYLLAVLCLPSSGQHTAIQLATAVPDTSPLNPSPLASSTQGRCHRGVTRELRGMVLPLADASRTFGRSTFSTPPYNSLVPQPVIYPLLVPLLPGLSHYSVSVWRMVCGQD
jgi:hypothetical protein